MAVARVKKWDDEREIVFDPPEAWDLAVGQGGVLIWTVCPSGSEGIVIRICGWGGRSLRPLMDSNSWTSMSATF